MRFYCIFGFLINVILIVLQRKFLGIAPEQPLGPNFASSSAGAVVIDSSPTWIDPYPSKYFFFIRVKTLAPEPKIALEPSREPGECWPMKGTRGHLLVRLAANAIVESFTLRHIDSAHHLAGKTTEAPKKFTVYGVLGTKNGKRHLFGEYHFKEGVPIQNFAVQNPSEKSFRLIDLVITENHGHPLHTCIYRFEVHGKMKIDEVQC